MPNPYSFTTTNNAEVGKYVYQLTQITGIASSETATISGGGQYQGFAVSSSSTRLSAASFTTANKTIFNNWYYHIRNRAVFASEEKITSTTVGSESATWTINGADPANEFPAIGTPTYGIQVFSGADRILSPSYRYVNIIATGNYSIVNGVAVTIASNVPNAADDTKVLISLNRGAGSGTAIYTIANNNITVNTTTGTGNANGFYQVLRIG